MVDSSKSSGGLTLSNSNLVRRRDLQGPTTCLLTTKQTPLGSPPSSETASATYPEPASLPPDQARFRLFDSFTRALRRAAQREPRLIVLEDLHWADAPTLLVLQFASPHPWGTPLVILATYCNLDVFAGGALADLLGQIARFPSCERLPLRGLSTPEVHDRVEAVNGRSPSAETRPQPRTRDGWQSVFHR
jgi:predicted ATPase